MQVHLYAIFSYTVFKSGEKHVHVCLILTCIHFIYYTYIQHIPHRQQLFFFSILCQCALAHTGPYMGCRKGTASSVLQLHHVWMVLLICVCQYHYIRVTQFICVTLYCNNCVCVHVFKYYTQHTNHGHKHTFLKVKVSATWLCVTC